MNLVSQKHGAKIYAAALLFLFLLGTARDNFVRAQQTDQGRVNQAAEEDQQPQPNAAQGGEPINLVEKLNLTPDQKAQIRALREEHGGPIREAIKRRNRAQRALQEAIYAENADEATIQTRTRELSEAQADLANLRTGVELRIRRILTPEQLQRFREIRQQRAQQLGAANAQNRQLRREVRRQLRLEKQLERKVDRPLRPNRALRP